MMKKIIAVWVVVAAFLLTGLPAWAKEGGNKGPSESAWKHANENASFKRTADAKDPGVRKAMKEEKALKEKAEKEAKKAEKEAKKAKDKAEKEARKAQKEAEKEAKRAQKKISE